MDKKVVKLPFRRASNTTRMYGITLATHKRLGIWVLGLVYFDHDIGFENLTQLVRTKVIDKMPRFRSRYVTKKNGFQELPMSEIDLDYHLKKVDEVMSVDDVLTEYMSQVYKHFEFDINKPLWRFTYFKNLADGRSLLMTNISHAIGDGVSQVALLFKIMDEKPPQKTEAIEGKPASGNNIQDTVEDDVDVIDVQNVETFKANENTKLNDIKSGQKPRRKVKNAYGPLNKTRIFIGGILGAVMSATARPDSEGPLKRKFGKMPDDICKMAFTPEIPLDKVKELKNKYTNATVNDILVALLTMTLKRYLENCPDGAGKPFIEGKKKFRASFPINIRRKNEDAFGKDNSPHNRLAMGMISFPLNFTDRKQLVYIVKAKLDRIKLSPLPYVQKSLGDFLVSILDQKGVAKLFTDFAGQASGQLSNVMGPQEPVYLLGNEVVDLQFGLFTPGSVYLGLISYKNEVKCCVCLDGGLGDPKDLATYWKSEFDALYEETMQHEGVVPYKRSFFSFLDKL